MGRQGRVAVVGGGALGTMRATAAPEARLPPGRGMSCSPAIAEETFG